MTRAKFIKVNRTTGTIPSHSALRLLKNWQDFHFKRKQYYWALTSSVDISIVCLLMLVGAMPKPALYKEGSPGRKVETKPFAVYCCECYNVRGDFGSLNSSIAADDAAMRRSAQAGKCIRQLCLRYKEREGQ